MNAFLWPLRVYYEDTDSGGVVYYANYLKFMERARTELLRSLGFEQDQLIRDQGLIFAVRAVSVDYLKPARFNDLLQVRTSIGEHGKASVTFEQTIHRGQANEELLCSGSVRVVCLDCETLRPRRIPPALLQEVSRER